jgi:hypothetical protein
VKYTVSVTVNRPGATVVCNPPSGSAFQIGVTTVQCVATDVAGNQASASFTVTVVDTQKPVLNLPMNITVTIASNETSATFTVTVRRDTGGDTQPPVIVSITPSKTCLWPPNHKMVPITIAVKATDNSGQKITSRIISVTSNEPENGLGDGDTGPDWKITGDLKLQLRAERSGLGTGRLYTITVEVKDAAGNVSYGTTAVCVSHDQSDKKNTTTTKRK